MEEFNFQWHITDFCNLRCKHCYQSDFTKKADLNWQALKSICNNIFRCLKYWQRVSRINITGGEPFLKKEIFILLEYLNKSPQIKELTIISNGTVLNEAMIRDLKRFPKLKKIKLSLEGLEGVNDAIRGKGVFQKVENAINLLKALGDFEVILMFTLLKRNILELPHIFDFCKKSKLNGLIIERFVPLGGGSKIKEEVLDWRQWQEAVKLILDFCSLAIIDEDQLLPYKAFWLRFSPKEVDLQGAFCNVGDQALCIMPQGDVYPCRRFNLSIGNLLKDSLIDIWQRASILRQVRQKENLKGRCKGCDIKECIGCRALAYSLSGDYLAQDPQCWYGNNAQLSL